MLEGGLEQRGSEVDWGCKSGVGASSSRVGGELEQGRVS